MSAAVAGLARSISTLLERPLDVLVLGDPAGTHCNALHSEGHRVSCCPDLQRLSGVSHRRVVMDSADELLDDDHEWDLVVAVEGCERMQWVRSAPRWASLMDWVSTHAQFAVQSAPRDVLAHDLHDLGPYALDELLARWQYVTEVIPDEPAKPESGRPVLALSQRALYWRGDWLELLEKLWSDSDAGQKRVRTYGWGDAILKIEYATENYFERCEALGEAVFLDQVDPQVDEILGLPAVRDVQRGRATSVVLRQRIEGTPLTSGALESGRIRIEPVVDLAVLMAANGVFHNDLRPWNLLSQGERVLAVDWGDAALYDADVQGLPQIVALAATLASLMTDEIPWGEPFYGTVRSRLLDLGHRDAFDSDAPLLRAWPALPDMADDIVARISGMTSADAILNAVLDVAAALGDGAGDD